MTPNPAHPLDGGTSGPVPTQAPLARRHKRTKRAILWIAGAIAVLVGSAMGYHHFILDWEGRPICHKGLMLVSFLTIDTSGACW